MSRQVYLSALVGFVIGMSFTSFLKNLQKTNELKIAQEAVTVTANVAKQYIDGYNKLNEHNGVLFEHAKLFGEAKSDIEKAKIAETIVFKIREFNLPISK